MAAALAPLLGGLLGAGGQVAGGILGSATGGQGKTSTYNPYLDYAMQAAQYSALDPLGFGQLRNVPDPFQQLIGQIQAMPMDNKTRRRALIALENVRSDPSLLNDPFGAQFSRDQIFEANKTGNVPFGRVLTRGPEGGGGSSAGGALGAGVGGLAGGPLGALVGGLAGAFGGGEDTQPTGLPVRNIGRLQNALRGAGLNLPDLQETLKRQQEHRALIQRLEEAGVGKMNEDTILNRARAASTAAELLGGAADFARTGQPGNAMSQTLLDRDNRMLQDLQSRLGIMANFGGISPAAMFDQLGDAKLDQSLRLIEQQLGMGNALQAAYNPATSAATAIASQGSQASLNSAQIAAQQAMAANQLRSQQAMNQGSSLGAGIAGGLGSLGSTIANQSLLSQIYGGSGSSAGLNFVNQNPFADVASMFAVPGVSNR